MASGEEGSGEERRGTGETFKKPRGESSRLNSTIHDGSSRARVIKRADTIPKEVPV